MARTAACCGVVVALGGGGAQVATAEPVVAACESSPVETSTGSEDPQVAETTQPIQSTEPPIAECLPTPTVPDVPTTTDSTVPTESIEPEPETETSAPTSPTVPVAEAVPTAQPPATGDGITISAMSLLSGSPASLQPGQTWTGTVSMSVANADPTSGWTSTVSLSNPRGLATDIDFIPAAATYSAAESPCTSGGMTSAATTVSLTPDARDAKTGPAGCNTTWEATVSIDVPATGIVADTYSTTLTHSIY